MAATGKTPSSQIDRPGAEAWQLMWEVFKASKPYLEAVAGEFELSSQQLYALKHLSNERPLAMSDLASVLCCDASNVTAIVDKLESRGLVERKSADHDRRVKALLVTPAGAALQGRIRVRFEQAPPAIGNLPLEDQRSLRDLLRRALDSLAT